ncbi:MAG: hypothetical protein Q8Q14_01710 [Gemmatimonadales bacterium]|nr:hypothetical protein [Gemmatimonadales bacterium]
MTDDLVARGAVSDRLIALVPPPPGVTRDSAIALEPETLDRYWATIHRILFRRMVLRAYPLWPADHVGLVAALRLPN